MKWQDLQLTQNLNYFRLGYVASSGAVTRGMVAVRPKLPRKSIFRQCFSLIQVVLRPEGFRQNVRINGTHRGLGLEVGPQPVYLVRFRYCFEIGGLVQRF